MQKLLAGYHHFREEVWPEQHELFEELATKGQNPRALVISCIDSRVNPVVIFNADAGDMLVVRNVANLVPPYERDSAYHGTSAALEFGVRVLHIPNIIVLGHGLCGGVKALLNEDADPEAHDFIAHWMAMAESARVLAMSCPPEERQKCCEQEVIKISLKNLLTFPWIAEPVSAGSLKLHGAWFDIESGELNLLQPDGVFRALA